LLRFARNDAAPKTARLFFCALRAEHLLRFARSTLARHQEATMRFSMNSYLLGVGTVVGALAFGFGGGILLTKTAIKDTPTGPSRIERAARQEPAPAAPPVQVTEARPVPVPRPDPAPAAQPAPEPAPLIQAAADPKPFAEAAKPEPVKAAEPVRQVEAPKQAERQAERQAEQPVKQADAPKQIEQRESVQETTARAQRRAEREQRRAERRIAQERYYAERKARAAAYARVRQRPIEIQEQPARAELAFEREEPRQPNLFEGLFGRPAEAASERE
jgi:type IV secretory pathway VirB10-like protein